MSDLPTFDHPPVVEVSVSVQFRPIFGMRGLALAPLRARWSEEYPRIEEQPALPPVTEGTPVLVPQVQFNMVQLPPTRQWFLNDAGTELVQVQPDRLVINWRAGDPPATYPRYGHIRETFVRISADLAQFAADEQLGSLDITQAEISYVNAIETDPDDVGRIDRFLKGWAGTGDHHLGQPEQARMTLAFQIEGIGQRPVRLYAEVNPAQRPNGEPILFFTLTVRGHPGGKSLEEALKFLDEAHDHLVRSFDELTDKPMHEVWGKRA